MADTKVFSFPDNGNNGGGLFGGNGGWGGGILGFLLGLMFGNGGWGGFGNWGGGNTMSERGMYRNGMSYRRGGGRYREAYRDGNDMEGRGEGRYSY